MALEQELPEKWNELLRMKDKLSKEELLEHGINDVKLLVSQIQHLKNKANLFEALNTKFKEALKFYASSVTYSVKYHPVMTGRGAIPTQGHLYIETPPILTDRGKVANEALNSV